MLNSWLGQRNPYRASDRVYFQLNRDLTKTDRTCPRCSHTIGAVANQCVCPACRHAFYAVDPNTLPIRKRIVNFQSYDGRVKRWYPKVIQAAEQRIQQILGDADIENLGNFSAEFDASTAGPPTLVEQFNSSDVIRIIRFSTGNWRTVDSCIKDAVNQLASVLVVFTRNRLLCRTFETARLRIGHAIFQRQRIADDPDEHASIMIPNDLSTDQFFSLVDRVETELHLAGVGDVSGTGWGIGGWCIDLSGPSIEKCIAVATAELESHKFQFDVDRH